MEFPDLGKRCTAPACNLYDFLPYTCIYCKHIFCQEHFKLQDHHCPSLNDPNMDIRVPTCPICEKPVSVPRGQDPNIRMNEHIQNNCADLKPKNDNTCRKKGCTTKMLVPMQCPDCKRSFCVKHRLPVDHLCKGKQIDEKPVKQTNNTSRAEMERQRKDRIEQRKQEIHRLQLKAKQG
ncbi:zinc finger, AN1-type domain, partial [Rhizopus azygosporus]